MLMKLVECSYSVTRRGQYKPKFSCSKGQYQRDKCQWKRKSCFIQEANHLGRWGTNVLRPFLSCQLREKNFKGSLSERAAGYMSNLCAILGLVGIKNVFKYQASSAVYVLDVISFHLVGVCFLSKQLRNVCQIFIYVIQGTGSSVTRQVAGLQSKLLPVSWLNSYSLFLYLHIS